MNPNAITGPQQAHTHGWAAQLLSARGRWPDIASRLAMSLVLAGSFGLALGTRDGGPAFAQHALGVPLALAAVLLLALPALSIVLALFDVPIEAVDLGRAASRGAGAFGVTLAGCAPAVALFVISADSASGAFAVAAVALVFAGVVGLTQMYGAYLELFLGCRLGPPTIAVFSFVVFAGFVTVLAVRIWWQTLPILRGVL